MREFKNRLSRIGTIFETKFRSEMIQFCFTWGFIISLALYVGVGYHNNDDYDMVHIVKGIFPFDKTNFIFYSSSFLGSVYTWLYSNIGIFEWYVVLYILFVSMSMAIITHLIRQKFGFGSTFHLAVLCILFYLFGIKILTQVTFTHAAGLLSIAGILLLYSSMVNRSGIILNRRYIIASILIIIGSFYRFDMMLLIVVLVIITVILANIYITVLNRRAISKIISRHALIMYTAFISPILIAIVLQLWSVNALNLDEKAFVEQQKYRSNILDNNLLQKCINREEVLKSASWSTLEQDLYFNWIFMDIKEFETPILKKINENANFSRYDQISNRISRVRNIVADNIYINDLIMSSLLLCFLIISNKINAYNLVVSIVVAATTLIFLTLIAYYFKDPPNRVVYPVLLLMIVLVMILMKDPTGIEIGKANSGFNIVLLLIFTSIVVQNNRYTNRGRNLERDNINKLDQRLISSGFDYFISIPDNYPEYYHDDGIFVEDSKGRPRVYHTGPFHHHPVNYGFRTIWQKDSFISGVKHSKLVFYFAQRNNEQMLRLAKVLNTSISRHFGLNASYTVDTLGGNGYLLRFYLKNTL